MAKLQHPRFSRQQSLGAALARAIERDEGPDAERWIKAAHGDLSGMERDGVAPSDLALRLGSARAFDAILRHGRWTPRGRAGLFISALRAGSISLIPKALASALDAHALRPGLLLEFNDHFGPACLESGDPQTLPFAIDCVERLGAHSDAFKAATLLAAIDQGRGSMVDALLALGAFEASPLCSPGPAMRACSAWVQFEIELGSQGELWWVAEHFAARRPPIGPVRLQIVRSLFEKIEPSWPVELAANEFEACSKVLREAPIMGPGSWSSHELPVMARLADTLAIQLSVKPAPANVSRMRI